MVGMDAGPASKSYLQLVIYTTHHLQTFTRINMYRNGKKATHTMVHLLSLTSMSSSGLPRDKKYGDFKVENKALCGNKN